MTIPNAELVADAPPAVAAHGYRVSTGTVLLGPYQGSGFSETPYLVRRADGKTVQVSHLLYVVLDALANNEMTQDVIQEVQARSGRILSPETLQLIVERKLAAQGLIGEAPPVAQVKARPILSLGFKMGVIPPRLVRALTTPFLPLFWGPIVLAILGALIAVDLRILSSNVLGTALSETAGNSARFSLVLGLGIVAALFHEIGHAAAARYGGARPGKIGAGIYLFWPVFFSEVSDSLSLSRFARLRVDLGGIYFSAIFAVGAAVAYEFTGNKALVVLVLVQHVGILIQCFPFLRLDGYYVICDLIGVADVFPYARSAIAGLVPGRRPGRLVERLRRPVRVLVAIWAVGACLAFAGACWLMISLGPLLARSIVQAAGAQAGLLIESLSEGNLLQTLAPVFRLALLSLPVLGISLALVRTLGSLGRFVSSRAGKDKAQVRTESHGFSRAWRGLEESEVLAHIASMQRTMDELGIELKVLQAARSSVVSESALPETGLSTLVAAAGAGRSLIEDFEAQRLGTIAAAQQEAQALRDEGMRVYRLATAQASTLIREACATAEKVLARAQDHCQTETELVSIIKTTREEQMLDNEAAGG
ncbi:MAG: hypothetical protein ACT4OM_03095 [Actinomycetota bacterium]